MCCPFLCKLTTQSIEIYGKINLAGMCSHPINANRLRCQSEKWADMGTFNTEWWCDEASFKLSDSLRAYFPDNFNALWQSIPLKVVFLSVTKFNSTAFHKNVPWWIYCNEIWFLFLFQQNSPKTRINIQTSKHFYALHRWQLRNTTCPRLF